MQAYREYQGGSKISQLITSASSIRIIKLASDEDQDKGPRAESIDDSVPQINNETERIFH